MIIARIDRIVHWRNDATPGIPPNPGEMFEILPCGQVLILLKVQVLPLETVAAQISRGTDSCWLNLIWNGNGEDPEQVIVRTGLRESTGCKKELTLIGQTQTRKPLNLIVRIKENDWVSGSIKRHTTSKTCVCAPTWQPRAHKCAAHRNSCVDIQLQYYTHFDVVWLGNGAIKIRNPPSSGPVLIPYSRLSTFGREAAVQFVRRVP